MSKIKSQWIIASGTATKLPERVTDVQLTFQSSKYGQTGLYLDARMQDIQILLRDQQLTISWKTSPKLEKFGDLTGVTFIMDISLSPDDKRFEDMYAPSSLFFVDCKEHPLLKFLPERKRTIYIKGFAIRNDGVIVHNVIMGLWNKDDPYKILLTKQEIDELRGVTDGN